MITKDVISFMAFKLRELEKRSEKEKNGSDGFITALTPMLQF